MECPTCGEYGDLLRATVKKTGQAVIVCTECDALWEQAEAQTDAASMLDVASFLAGLGLHGSWEELEVLVRLPSL